MFHISLSGILADFMVLDRRQAVAFKLANSLAILGSIKDLIGKQYTSDNTSDI